MSTIAMAPGEIRAYLEMPRVAAVGMLDAAGNPQVFPAGICYDDRHVYAAIEHEMALDSVKMPKAEIDKFLTDYRYPETGAPLFIAAATLRKDGSCFVVPLGQHYDGRDWYFHLLETRAMLKRIRRDHRVAVTAFTQRFPLRTVVMEGVAQEVDADDPAKAYSHEIVGRQLASPRYQDMLDTTWKDTHLAIPHVLFRVVPSRVLAWDDRKLDATGPPARVSLRPRRNRQMFLALFNSHMPLKVLLAEAAGQLVQQEREANEFGQMIVERQLQGIEDVRADFKAAWASRPRSVYRLKLGRVMAWDQARDASNYVSGSDEPLRAPWQTLE